MEATGPSRSPATKQEAIKAPNDSEDPAVASVQLLSSREVGIGRSFAVTKRAWGEAGAKAGSPGSRSSTPNVTTLSVP